MCTETSAADVLLTAEEVAELLKVHVTTVYRLAASGRLEAHRIGEGTKSPRGLRIWRSAFDAFMAASLIAPEEIAS